MRVSRFYRICPALLYLKHFTEFGNKILSCISVKVFNQAVKLKQAQLVVGIKGRHKTGIVG
jgi:hypothetical protein